MIDGTYEVMAKTPLGKQSGMLTLTTAGNACDADLTILGKDAHLSGTLDGEVATFTGSIDLPFPLGKQDWELVGSVSGDILVGKCRTKKFEFDVQGTRVS